MRAPRHNSSCYVVRRSCPCEVTRAGGDADNKLYKMPNKRSRYHDGSGSATLNETRCAPAGALIGFWCIAPAKTNSWAERSASHTGVEKYYRLHEEGSSGEFCSTGCCPEWSFAGGRDNPAVVGEDYDCKPIRTRD